MTKTQKQKALFPLRFAVKGWAFTSETMLRGKLTHCEQVASALPAELAADATEYCAHYAKQYGGSVIRPKDPTHDQDHLRVRYQRLRKDAWEGTKGLRLLGLRLAGQPARPKPIWAPTSGYADAKRWVKEHICEMAPADYAGHIHITVCT